MDTLHVVCNHSSRDIVDITLLQITETFNRILYNCVTFVKIILNEQIKQLQVILQGVIHNPI